LPAIAVLHVPQSEGQEQTVKKNEQFAKRAMDTPFKMPASYNIFAA